jgi:hypothetical protein
VASVVFLMGWGQVERASVIELWHDGLFIGQVTGADGPGVRIISKYSMTPALKSGVPAVIEMTIGPDAHTRKATPRECGLDPIPWILVPSLIAACYLWGFAFGCLFVSNTHEVDEAALNAQAGQPNRDPVAHIDPLESGHQFPFDGRSEGHWHQSR